IVISITVGIIILIVSVSYFFLTKKERENISLIEKSFANNNFDFSISNREKRIVARRSTKCSNEEIAKLEMMVQELGDDYYAKGLEYVGYVWYLPEADIISNIVNYVESTDNLKYYVALKYFSNPDPFWSVVFYELFWCVEPENAAYTKLTDTDLHCLRLYTEDVKRFIRID
ncbi:MAG: hypothetical protein J6113_03025, partial [Lachnospiraceae bacterium]|nr:hypothetical protein [Lachnospiraceae bacterium]